MSLLEHFCSLLAYEVWASSATLDSMASCLAGDSAFAARARGIFAHMQLARQMWLYRLGGGEKPIWEMFPDWSIERCREETRATNQRWTAFLSTLDEASLSKDIQYTSTEGKGYRNTLAQILTHAFNHSTYHRGQIAMLVVQAGGRSAVTDAIAMMRQAV